jgi:DNA-binding response OmpR family regulator
MTRPLQIGCLTFTPGDPRILIRGEPVFLSARELELLEVLAQRPGQPVRMTDLAARLARRSEPPTETAIAVGIHRLRQRLAAAGLRIHSVRGLGYLLDTTEGEA